MFTDASLTGSCVAILILKMEEDMQHFQCIILFLFSRKVKTQLELKKVFVQCVEKVL